MRYAGQFSQLPDVSVVAVETVAEPEIQARPVQALFTQYDVPEVLSVLGPIGNYLSHLHPIERDSVSNAVTKRQREFATGRMFARILMGALDLPLDSIPAGPNRAPQWPSSLCGSISHSDELAWVIGVPGAHPRVRGLGADIERLQRLQADLNDKLFTAAERQRLHTLAADPTNLLLSGVADARAREQQLATLWFSAKEAVYKATAPIAGAFIGFQEVELLPSADGLQFTMRYLGEHQPSAIMEQGSGCLRVQNNHALALYTIVR